MLRTLVRIPRQWQARHISQVHFGPSDDVLQEIMERNLVCVIGLAGVPISICSWARADYAP
jgi:hypothetical protein